MILHQLSGRIYCVFYIVLVWRLEWTQDMEWEETVVCRRELMFGLGQEVEKMLFEGILKMV